MHTKEYSIGLKITIYRKNTMADDHNQSSATIGPLNYSGYLDWPHIYTAMTNWAKNENMKIFEPVYKDKTDAQGFTEREMTIAFIKKVDRLNKYIITVSIRLWDCQPVEITENGTKRTVERGRARFLLSSVIDRDWQNIFDESLFWKKMRRVYYQLRNWDWNLDHWDTLYAKAYDLNKVIKQALGMDTA